MRRNDRDLGVRASDAMSTVVWCGCAGVSSGRTRIGVRQDRAKSRDTLYTKSGPYPVEVVKIPLDCFHSYVRPASAELGDPILVTVPVHDIRVFRPVSDRLAAHSSDDALRRPLQELQGKRAADSIAHNEKFADAEMVHQPQLVVGQRRPKGRWPGSDRCCRSHSRFAGPS
jgi:hypothetical protein